MTPEIASKLAIHPGGALLVAYQREGRIWSAFYIRGDFVRPHPDTGWAVSDSKDGRASRLTAAELQQLREIAPTPDQPPILPELAGILSDGAARLGGSGRAAVVVRLDEVAPERVAWLWKGRLPRGKVVVLDGDPDLGKSTITLDLTARTSTGSPMPDGQPLQRAEDVLLLSAEDGLADTIVPRLLAAGGDPSRVHAVTEMVDIDDEGNQTRRPPVLPDDIGRLEALVVDLGVGLVIVDVLNAYLSSRVNGHRDQDIRRALHPLAAVADRTGATVVVLRHLNKSEASNPLYRGGGSIGIIGAARAGLLVAPDPDDPTGTRRVLAVTKSNLAAKPTALAYRLVPDDLYGCAQVVWDGPVGHTAAQLLAIRSERTDDEGDDSVDACAALGEVLAGGPRWVKDALTELAAAGFSKDQAKRAKAKLHAYSVKVGKPGDSEQGWQWTLPRREHEESEGSNPLDSALFAPLALPSVDEGTGDLSYEERSDPPEGGEERKPQGTASFADFDHDLPPSGDGLAADEAEHPTSGPSEGDSTE